MLPTDQAGTTAGQARQVDSVGPTFWIGGTVTDPNSLFGEAFLELQFYPKSIVTNCTAGGGFDVTYSANTYSACSPVWEVSQHGNSESAAFNAMLTDHATGGPLLMHAGDTITDHQYMTAARDGMHITVTDRTTGHSGTIDLNSKVDGPLMPASLRGCPLGRCDRSALGLESGRGNRTSNSPGRRSELADRRTTAANSNAT